MLREVELQPAGRRDDERDDAALLPTPGGVLGGRASPAPPGPRAWGAALVDGMRREPLLARTLAGVFVGALLGAAVRRAAPSPRAVELIGFPGELFMRLLRALTLPLVSVSMASGVASLAERAGAEERRGGGGGATRRGRGRRVASRVLACYALTTLCAVALGLLVVALVRPGEGVSLAAATCERTPEHRAAAVSGAATGTSADDAAAAAADAKPSSDSAAADSLLRVARAAVPSNALEAASEGNILGVMTASLLTGAALASALASDDDARRRAAEPFRALLRAAEVVVDIAVGWAVALMPPGVFSLVAGRVAGACDPIETLAALGKFVFAVLLGLALHLFAIAPGLYALATRRGSGGAAKTRSPENENAHSSSPAHRSASRVVGAYGVLRASSPAMFAAFATDSSSAALPVTRRCADALGIPRPVADFALPLGATVNMNGTALYEAVAALFIAQTHDVPLTFGRTVVVAATSTIAAVGAASVPSAGLVTMLIVLQAAGLEEYAGDVGALFALDWALDRCRTAVNVAGDLMVAKAVAEWEATSAGGGEEGEEGEEGVRVESELGGEKGEGGGVVEGEGREEGRGGATG